MENQQQVTDNRVSSSSEETSSSEQAQSTPSNSNNSEGTDGSESETNTRSSGSSTSSVDDGDSEGTDESSDGDMKPAASKTETLYQDMSHLPPLPKKSNSASSSNQKQAAKEPTFPVKLHMMLSNPEFEGKGKHRPDLIIFS